jgi:PAS domain S-box-containing protein
VTARGGALLYYSHEQADYSGKSREELIKELKELRDRVAATKPERATRARNGPDLADSDRTLRLIAGNVNEVIFMFTPDWRKAIYVSPAYDKIWGRPVDEVYRDARSWMEAIVPGDRGRVDAFIEGQSRGEIPFENSIEYRIRTPDGDVRWINGRTYPVRDESGNIARVAGIAEDITERRKAEDAFRVGSAYNRSLIESSLDPLVTIAPDGRITDVNAATEAVTGLPREALVGTDFSDYFTEPGKAREGYLTVFREGSVTDYPLEIRHRAGGVTPVIYNASVYRDEAGKVIGVFAAARDVTERKRAEEALKESEEKFRVLAETTKAGIMLYRGTNVVYVNPALEQITGYGKDELLAMNYWDIVDPEQKEMVRSRGLARQQGLSPVPSTYEIKVRTKSGEIRWVELSAALINYHGRQTGLATIFDITDRKRSEDELHDAKGQAELYLDLMGHDINNLNQIGIGFLEMALSTLKLDRESRELIARPLEAIEASSRLIANVRKLQKIKEGGLKFKKVRIADMLREIVPRYGDIPGRDVRITCDAGCDCTVMANDLLDDVFANLIHNAIKHSTGQLAIDVHLSAARVGDRKYALVAIEDDGPGIPDELKGRLFSRSGQGNAKATGRGLGLHLVRTLVEDFDGKVWVEDRVRGDHTKGTRFVIMLPAVE